MCREEIIFANDIHASYNCRTKELTELFKGVGSK